MMSAGRDSSRATHATVRQACAAGAVARRTRHVAHAHPDPHAARGGRRRGRRVPDHPAAADPGLPARRRRASARTRSRWCPFDDRTRYVAEFGIVFLMFSIGLEFSLPQLRAMRRAVFGLGLAQVAITTVAAMVALHFVGYGWQAGLVLGGALAMSSTAIVSKMLAERMELGTPHGRDVMGDPAVPGPGGRRVPDRDPVAVEAGARAGRRARPSRWSRPRRR